MTIPAVTVRGTPVGIKMPDGYSTKIACAANPTISFWEKSVKPFGMDGGDMIDTSTMLNIKVRTMHPRSLITFTESSGSAGYDPRVFVQLRAQLNVNQAWTVTMPDGSTISAYAALTKFEPQEHTEGAMPEAQFTLSPTNTDPVTGAEVEPEYVSAAGTASVA